MAKNVDLTSKEWCDLVFDGRNKEYGAYTLRMETKPRHLKAFILTIIGALCIGAVGVIYMSAVKYIEEQRLLDQAQQDAVVIDTSAEEEEAEEDVQERYEEPEVQALPEEILNTVKVTELLIAEDEEVRSEDEIKTQDELKETQTAFGQTDFDKGTDDRNVTREHKNEVIVEEKKPEPVKEEVFKAVEQMPTFPGGDAELMKWLRDHIQYPTVAMENNIQGRVVVQFVVGKDGSISNVHVSKSVESSLDEEAVRVTKSMPNWVPGKQDGQAVSVFYTLPITFRLP